MKRLSLALGFLLLCCTSQAQMARRTLDSLFQDWNYRLSKLNTEDPELISLHSFFSQDILQEMEDFKRNTIPKLAHCKQIDYYETVSEFYKTAYHARQLNQQLYTQKSKVDYLFYLRAVEELSYFDTTQALYNLDRAMQYNPYQTDALLLEANLMLSLGRYRESVELTHLIYTKALLTETQEKAVSDFTFRLYDYLYNLGDSLVKINRATEALEIFLALEQFCNNMPSDYCNDDYYRGIMRSRESIYESYIAIAKEAERRNNFEMARKFYQYADEYRKKSMREEEPQQVKIPQRTYIKEATTAKNPTQSNLR